MSTVIYAQPWFTRWVVNNSVGMLGTWWMLFSESLPLPSRNPRILSVYLPLQGAKEPMETLRHSHRRSFGNTPKEILLVGLQRTRHTQHPRVGFHLTSCTNDHAICRYQVPREPFRSAGREVDVLVVYVVVVIRRDGTKLSRCERHGNS